MTEPKQPISIRSGQCLHFGVLALLVAAFSHAYIWVHFFTVEKPDMAYIHAAGE